MKSLREILAEIEALYNKNPLGWNISVGADPHSSYGNIFISNPLDIWQIKIDSLYKPNPYGLGTKLGPVKDFPELFPSSSPSFGFRPLLPNHIQKLQKEVEREKPIDNVIKEILGSKPVSIDQIKSNALIGPVMHSSLQGYISDNQKALDRKLKRSLDDLLLSRGIGQNYI